MEVFVTLKNPCPLHFVDRNSIGFIRYNSLTQTAVLQLTFQRGCFQYNYQLLNAAGTLVLMALVLIFLNTEIHLIS